MGNICVRGKQSDVTNALSATSNGPGTKNLGHSKLRITIIDYTLSRVELEDDPDESGVQRISYFDLEKDLSLFKGEGEYQYDIYR